MADISISSNPQEVTPGDTSVHALKFDLDKNKGGEKMCTIKVQSGTFKFNSISPVVSGSPVYAANAEFKFGTKSGHGANFCWIQDQGGSGVIEVSYIQV